MQLPAAIKQAHERIFGGHPVPNADKILSLYEAEVEVLKRGMQKALPNGIHRTHGNRIKRKDAKRPRSEEEKRDLQREDFHQSPTARISRTLRVV